MPATTTNNVPGRANCRLTYGNKERVVDVEVLEKVKEARKVTLTEYPHDNIGPKHMLWNQSNLATTRTKHTRAHSTLSLGNTLGAGHILAADTRTLSAPTFTYDRQRDHTFTRGDCTTGWAHTTVLTPPQKRAALARMDHRATRHTLRTTTRLSAYTTPVQHEENFVAGQRAVKAAAADHRRELEGRYGLETAEMMLAIEKLPRPARPAVIRATAQDVADVWSLPPIPIPEDAPAPGMRGSAAGGLSGGPSSGLAAGPSGAQLRGSGPSSKRSSGTNNAPAAAAAILSAQQQAGALR